MIKLNQERRYEAMYNFSGYPDGYVEIDGDVTEDEIVEFMREYCRSGGEEGHIYADMILVELVRRAGYDKVADYFMGISGRWYA